MTEPNANATAPDPKAPDAGKNPAAPAAPAAPAGGATPAAPEKDWRAEADRLSKENQSLSRKAQIADALAPYYKENERGELVLVVPESETRNSAAGADMPDPQDLERERILKETEQRSATVTKKYVDLMERDRDAEVTLARDNVSDPFMKENLSVCREVVKKIPIERRDLQSWKNAYDYAKAKNIDKYREHWLAEGHKRGQEETVKTLGARVRKSIPTASVEETMDNLSDDELRYCRESGKDPKAYATRKLEIQAARQKGKTL